MRRLALHAGIIFTGTVEKVERLAPAAPGDVGVVRVTFRVSEALRGATAGATLTINEWDALWTGANRYRPGERLLLFLYPPSGSLGLTSTVGGERGRIRVSESRLSIASVARQIADPYGSTVADCDGQPWWALKPRLLRVPLD